MYAYVHVCVHVRVSACMSVCVCVSHVQAHALAADTKCKQRGWVVGHADKGNLAQKHTGVKAVACASRFLPITLSPVSNHRM